MRIKYYEDAKENAAFERCTDAITNMIIKYGPLLKKKVGCRRMVKKYSRGMLLERTCCKAIWKICKKHEEWWSGKKCCMTISD